MYFSFTPDIMSYSFFEALVQLIFQRGWIYQVDFETVKCFQWSNPIWDPISPAKEICLKSCERMAESFMSDFLNIYG